MFSKPSRILLEGELYPSRIKGGASYTPLEPLFKLALSWL
jgi:hypothetical protein